MHKLSGGERNLFRHYAEDKRIVSGPRRKPAHRHVLCVPFHATGHYLSFVRILIFQVANDGLPTIVDMDMLDANELLTTITEPSQHLDLSCKSLH
jgi:hypothetical protein